MSSKQTNVQYSAQKIYSGPLPQAGELIKYNEACPSAAERILAMAEEEAKHRHEIELLQEHNKWKAVRYSILASVITVVLLAGVIVYAIYKARQLQQWLQL